MPSIKRTKTKYQKGGASGRPSGKSSKSNKNNLYKNTSIIGFPITFGYITYVKCVWKSYKNSKKL